MNRRILLKLQQLLLAGESPVLTSALEPEQLGQLELHWPGGGLGAACPGHRYTQTLTAPVELVICGGGHVARCLAPAAQAVGFRVTVLENRPEVLEEGGFSPQTRLMQGAFDTLLGQGRFGPNTFYAIMTRGHQEDWTCLQAVLRLPQGYVGMIGSRRKVAATMALLREQGVAPEVMEAIHAPIGLDIGAQTPAEIAVSIVAQLIQCRRALGLDAPLGREVIDGLSLPAYALVTLVATQGSTPRGAGARMLVLPDGSIRGTIGGGISEATAKGQALETLKTGRAGLFTYRMDGSAGSICGGSVDYLIIPIKEEEHPPC